MRAFEINVSSKVPTGVKDLADFEKFFFLKMKRPFTCTMLCFNRPVMEIYSLEQGQEKYIGKISNPYSCTQIVFNIDDENNNPLYIIKGSLCQLGVLCTGIPCAPCQEAQFDICDKNGTPLKKLLKKAVGCLKAAISDVDEFAVIFPDNANVYQKALLMSAAMLLDYLFFEDKDQNRQNKGNNFGGFAIRF